MSNISKLEFVALDISGNNYLSWILDAEIHLVSQNLGSTIQEGNSASAQDRAKAMIFIRHHLHEGLKAEYLTVKDPYVLWTNLKERFDHQKTVILPKARFDWIHLRLQDYKTVSDYNSAVFRITSQLKLCGENITDEDMLEKTYSTFHASNLLLQQQYRQRGFTKYSELISCLLVAEQNNELLMKNHQSRPTGSEPLPETHAINAYKNQRHAYDRGNPRGRGRGHGRRHGRGRGRNNGRQTGHRKIFSSQGGLGPNAPTFKRNEYCNNGNNQRRETICRRCGIKGHWEKICRTAQHLVDLYQQSLKAKGKGVETNFVDNLLNDTYLDVSDFYGDPNIENQFVDENAKDD